MTARARPSVTPPARPSATEARTALVVVAALVAIACGRGHPPAARPECAVREDCTGGLAGGLLCQEGKCAGCVRSRDCRLTEVCDPVQRRCALRACFGDECTAHAACVAGSYCVQGLCLDPVKPRVVGSQTCGVQICGSDRDCNPGQRCNERTFVCEQDLGCLAGSPCAKGQVCNPGSGACEPGCTAQTAAQVCGALVPCIAGRCVQCARDADCGPGLSCDAGAGVCRGPSGCGSSRDCEPPKTCDRATATCALPRGPCTSNESCAPDERCETRTGRCVPGACRPDRFDPDGDQAHAAPVVPGSYPLLTLCGQDQDWFSVQLLSGDTVQVVADSDPLGSFDLQLRDASAVLEEAPSAVLHTVGKSGTYFVRALTNDASSLYGLRVQVAHGTPCDHRPPDAHPGPAQALPLPPGPAYDLTVCPGEATWFSVRVATGQGVDVTGSLSPTAGGPLVLTLFDTDGQTVLEQDASGTSAPHVAAAASRGQIFYLRVAGETGEVRNSYDLTVRVTGP